MAQQVVISGATYSDVPQILVPDANEVFHPFTDTSDTTAIASDVRSGKDIYLSDGTKTTGTAVLATATVSGSTLTLTNGFPVESGLEHIANLPKKTWKLSATDYNSWTPSTTATAIIASESAGTFTATDIATYDYFSRVRVFTDAVYPSGTSNAKGRFEKSCAENWYCLTRRASNNTNLTSSTRNSNVAESITNIYVTQYYNGGWVSIYSAGYGIYTANSAPTLSSTSAASPTVTVMTPIVNARCNATYFATSFANSLDKDSSTVTMTFDIYRCRSGYCRQIVNGGLMDMWNNGL